MPLTLKVLELDMLGQVWHLGPLLRYDSSSLVHLMDLPPESDLSTIFFWLNNIP